MQALTLRRREFQAIVPELKAKKIADRLERSAGCRDLYVWERLFPPSAVFGASAHPPQAPIWLDPSGCPPGRVFRFWRILPTVRGSRNSRYDPRNVAMQPCGLTVDSPDNPVFLRLSVNERCVVASLAGQRRSFPQNIPCQLQVIRPGCVRVRFSPTG